MYTCMYMHKYKNIYICIYVCLYVFTGVTPTAIGFMMQGSLKYAFHHHHLHL